MLQDCFIYYVFIWLSFASSGQRLNPSTISNKPFTCGCDHMHWLWPGFHNHGAWRFSSQPMVHAKRFGWLRFCFYNIFLYFNFLLPSYICTLLLTARLPVFLYASLYAYCFLLLLLLLQRLCLIIVGRITNLPSFIFRTKTTPYIWSKDWDTCCVRDLEKERSREGKGKRFLFRWWSCSGKQKAPKGKLRLE